MIQHIKYLKLQTMNKLQRNIMWYIFFALFLITFIGGSISNEFGSYVFWISIGYFIVALLISTYYAIQDKKGKS